MTDISYLYKYRNENVIARYMKEYKSKRSYAERMFHELMKYLWLTQQAKKEGIAIMMYSEMRPIDKMWHTFLLFNRDYTSFSEKYFDHYIHHQPTVMKESKKCIEETFFKFCGYVFDHAGIETLNYWFGTRINPKLRMDPIKLKNHVFRTIFKSHFEYPPSKELVFN